MMTPIYHQFLTQIETEIKDECITVAQKYHIEVNEEGLIQALTNARKFYDEGYADGQRDAVKRGEWEPAMTICNRGICSECGEMGAVRWNFCPKCGADMRSHHDSLCDQTEAELTR